MFTKKILAAAITSQPSANGVADAIDFDGANDYLSRSSDLVGNVDGKTFTFSAWVDIRNTKGTYAIYSAGGYFEVKFSGGSSLYAAGVTAAGGAAFSFEIANAKDLYLFGSFFHILVSVNLSNTGNRYVYINDQQQSPSWTMYNDVLIDFTRSSHTVAGSQLLKGRLAHVFLDYQYRDLSITANRRLFITADRKPAANQAALNPILYLPLSDPTQPGKNLGTGGDFALNGVVARSGRGPSQFNAPYSDLDGSTDYLSRNTAPTGIVDGKQVTIAFTFNSDTFVDYQTVFSITSNAKETFTVQIANNRKLLISEESTSILYVETGTTFQVGRNYTVVISFDLSDHNKRHITINGQTDASTWVSFADKNLALAVASVPRYRIGVNGSGSSYTNGRLGNVFFDTKYIDLSQPANLAKFVTGTGIDAKPADLGANGEKPFGTPPLIYLPMYGNNAGKNYGTGGDFTVNSGPFTGARGPNEFWGNKADFDGSTGYLYRTSALTGVSDSKTLSCSFWIHHDTINVTKNITGMNNAGSETINIWRQNDNTLSMESSKFSFTGITAAGSGGPHHVLVCVDLTSTSKRFVFVNGTQQSPTWLSYTNAAMLLSNWIPQIGASNSSYFFDGKLSEFYFTTDYIDFSQEANRLKFRDAFGNPVDLAPQIAAGTLPNPAIYMRFDPANFGKNSGTGGDFVVNGTITDGGQL